MSVCTMLVVLAFICALDYFRCMWLAATHMACVGSVVHVTRGW